MVRVEAGGVAMEGEVWALPAAAIGPFLAEIPPPLGFGRVELADSSAPARLPVRAGGGGGPARYLGAWRLAGLSGREGHTVMDVDLPEVLAEVTACFAAYERALQQRRGGAAGAVPARPAHPAGPAENLLGWEAIAAFRAGRSPVGLERVLENTVITTYGHDFATANTEFLRAGRRGRQSQTWVRFPDDGWRIVAAHVSLMPYGGPEAVSLSPPAASTSPHLTRRCCRPWPQPSC